MRSRRAAGAALIALAAVLTVGALSFAAPSATAVGGLSPLEVAQVNRANCQVLLAHATSSAQRTRANTCIADMTVVINALSASPSPSGSPSPTPPGPTATPTPPPTTPVPTSPVPTSSSPVPTTEPPTPTPTPTGPAAAWPTDCRLPGSTTGWQHTGVTLAAPRTTLLRVTTTGAVIDGQDLQGGVEVQADDVTIKRSRVQGASTGPGAGIWIDAGVTGTTVEDVEVESHHGYRPTVESDLVDRAITAFNTFDTTMTRVCAHDMIRGLQFGCRTVIQDSWVDHEVNPSTDHMSAIGGETCDVDQARGGRFSLIVRHNWVGLTPNDMDSAALLYYPPQRTCNPTTCYGAQHADITIVDNYVAGGTYGMWLSSDPQLDGTLTVVGNRFGTDYYPMCGRFGALFSDKLSTDPKTREGGLDITWSDNLLGSLIVVAPHG